MNFLWFHEKGEGGVSVHSSGVVKGFKVDAESLIFFGSYSCLFDVSDINHSRFAGTFVYSEISFNLNHMHSVLDAANSPKDALVFHSIDNNRLRLVIPRSVYVLKVKNRKDFNALKSWVKKKCNRDHGDWVSSEAKNRAHGLVFEMKENKSDYQGIICDTDSKVNMPHQVVVVGTDGIVITSEKFTLSPGARLDNPIIAFCLIQKHPPSNRYQNVSLALTGKKP